MVTTYMIKHSVYFTTVARFETEEEALDWLDLIHKSIKDTNYYLQKEESVIPYVTMPLVVVRYVNGKFKEINESLISLKGYKELKQYKIQLNRVRLRYFLEHFYEINPQIESYLLLNLGIENTEAIINQLLGDK